MKKLILILIMAPSLVWADCNDIFEAEVARSQALGTVDMIDDLYAQLDQLRKNNGHLNRNSKVMRDRRLALLKIKLEQGENAQIAAVYAPIFEKVDLAVHTIKNHVPYIEGDKKLVENEEDNPKALARLNKMADELSKAYKDLGVHYIDYVMARDYLTEKALDTNRNAYVRTNANRLLTRLSLSLRASQINELGILSSNPTPPMDEVRNAFASNIEPLVALLRHDINEEKLPFFEKYGLTAIQMLESAVMSLGGVNILGFQLGGQRLQSFLTALVGVSRDQYLKREYLAQVEEIINQRRLKHRAKNLLEACNRQCPELLETFARVGLFTDDWALLVQHFKDQAEKKGGQYKRVLALMVAADKVAQRSAGLSVNYEDIKDQYGRRFLISSAARALAVGLAVTHETWIGWLQSLSQVL